MERVTVASGSRLQDLINIVIVAYLDLGFKPKKGVLVPGTGNGKR